MYNNFYVFADKSVSSFLFCTVNEISVKIEATVDFGVRCK
jgi:hypothetical protein